MGIFLTTSSYFEISAKRNLYVQLFFTGLIIVIECLLRAIFGPALLMYTEIA